MKIYIGHSREFDFKNELYKPIRESNLNSEHEIIFPHEDEKEFITKDVIESCDLMIAEVSYPSIGLGIELGWANSFGRRIICINRKGAKASESLKAVCEKFVEYTDKDDLVSKIDSVL